LGGARLQSGEVAHGAKNTALQKTLLICIAFMNDFIEPL
jgi:hypothetical protein